MSTPNKVWFVTGTSSGFGRSIVEEVIRRGERVVATARDPHAVEHLVALAPDRVLALRLDVTKSDQIQAAVAAAIERFGAVDVLVNNAGYSIVGAVEETSEEELRAAFEPMFFGAVAVTRALLPHMRERRSAPSCSSRASAGSSLHPGLGHIARQNTRSKRCPRHWRPSSSRLACAS